MQVDLLKGAAEIRAMLVEGVRRYAGKHAHPKAGPYHPPVTAIDLVFFLGNAGEVGLSFDTRPDRAWDGTWTHGWFVTINLSEWQSASEAAEFEEIVFILLDKTSRTLVAGIDDEAHAELYGGALVSVLKTACDDGLFASLPRASRCELRVFELEGIFAWPWHENHGNDNRV